MVVESAIISQLTYGKPIGFQGKRHSKVACHFLPPYHQPGIFWMSLLQIPPLAYPAYIPRSDMNRLAWALSRSWSNFLKCVEFTV